MEHPEPKYKYDGVSYYEFNGKLFVSSDDYNALLSEWKESLEREANGKS